MKLEKLSTSISISIAAISLLMANIWKNKESKYSLQEQVCKSKPTIKEILKVRERLGNGLLNNREIKACLEVETETRIKSLANISLYSEFPKIKLNYDKLKTEVNYLSDLIEIDSNLKHIAIKVIKKELITSTKRLENLKLLDRFSEVQIEKKCSENLVSLNFIEFEYRKNYMRQQFFRGLVSRIYNEPYKRIKDIHRKRMKDLLYKKDLLPTTIACAAKRDKNSTFNLLIKHNQEMLNYFKKFTKVINNKLESDPNSTFLCSLKIPQTLNSTQQDCDFNSKRSDIKNIKLRKYLNLREEVEFNI